MSEQFSQSQSSRGSWPHSGVCARAQWGDRGSVVAGVPNSYNRVQHTSRPVAATREDGSQANLADTLNHLLPEYFEPRPSDNSNIGETASVSADPSLKSGEAGPQVCCNTIEPRARAVCRPLLLSVPFILPQVG